MSAPRPVQDEILEEVKVSLQRIEAESKGNQDPFTRLEILSYISSLLSGVTQDEIYSNTPMRSTLQKYKLKSAAETLLKALQKTSLPPALSLAILAEPENSVFDKKVNGVYYTDFRLAEYLAGQLSASWLPGTKIVDPACGTGILLVAVVLKLSNGKKNLADRILREAICGADLSKGALNGAKIALSSLAKSIGTVRLLGNRLRCMDSLLVLRNGWQDVAPKGFDYVIGNPPWEKLKITRHEWLQSTGVKRSYGESYSGIVELSGLKNKLLDLQKYGEALDTNFLVQGNGERDLYKLFVELSTILAKPNGRIGLIVPAGLIRAQGTSNLRAHVFSNCSEFDFAILDNRPRFFGIDTRFKFLTLHATLGKNRPMQPIRINQLGYGRTSITLQNRVPITRAGLSKIRPDLSVPEVKSIAEWRLFKKMSENGVRMGDALWNPQFTREVDMTQDSENFMHEAGTERVPLLEGRMVHQYRFSAKRHIEGTGRKALWQWQETDSVKNIRPQYYFPKTKLSSHILKRISSKRAGFCDISGQTNERTMLSARIPQYVVCGNKVPTVMFPHAHENEDVFIDAWIGIVNSFAFDWLLRRVATTTVNFFLLLDLPMPKSSPTSLIGRKIGVLSETISNNPELSLWQRAEYRAEIEWLALKGYSLGVSELEMVLKDFPLLDRRQPPLPGEKRSTITRDFVLLRACENIGGISESKIRNLRGRVDVARCLGAIPFIPSDSGAF